MARSFSASPTWRAGTFVNNPPPNPVENWSDFFSACVLCRGVPNPFGLPGKNLFLRGFPDQYVVQGQNLAGQLFQFFGLPTVQNLQCVLLGIIAPNTASNPFGWLGQPMVANGQQNVFALAQNTNGTVQITLKNALASLPASALGNPNYFVPIYIHGLRQPKNLNGVTPCSIDATGTILTTRKRIAIGPWDMASGSVRYWPKVFVPFNPAVINLPTTGNITTYGNLYSVRGRTQSRSHLWYGSRTPS